MGKGIGSAETLASRTPPVLESLNRVESEMSGLLCRLS